jgi:hypothetical protein
MQPPSTREISYGLEGCLRQRFAFGLMPSLSGLTNESLEVFL